MSTYALLEWGDVVLSVSELLFIHRADVNRFIPQNVHSDDP